MTYTVTADTLASFMIDLWQRISHGKTVVVDFVNQEDLYLSSQEYQQLQRSDWKSAEETISDLSAMVK
jgi:precorrin-6B methylase 2